MRTAQSSWVRDRGWIAGKNQLNEGADLVLVFGETSLLKQPDRVSELKKKFPGAHLLGASTSGEIHGDRVHDDTLVATAIKFEGTTFRHADCVLERMEDSFAVGTRLGKELNQQDLVHVLVLSPGLNVNGSELVRGLANVLPKNVSITGGLAGDKDRFKETVILSGNKVSSQLVAVVGLYGQKIRVGTASLGGWDPFGPERLVTKSHGNVLFELDGKSALQLYKTYLGEHAKDLPGSALLFPLCLRNQESKGAGIVRTILSVSEENQSMTFAGDIPEGSYGRFMKANFDRLIEGAVGAARITTDHTSSKPDFALLISCVGRKIVLGQRVEEEVEGVREIFGDGTTMTGFYSYGEISPFTPNAKCELHNQTMTITTFTEKA